MTASGNPAQLVIGSVLWILWLPIAIGLLVLRVFAVAPAPPVSEQVAGYSVMTGVCVILAVIVLGIRWLLIPRCRRNEHLIAPMLVGTAMSNSIGIIGMFAVPSAHQSERQLLFAMAVVCQLMMAPIYARWRVPVSPPTLPGA